MPRIDDERVKGVGISVSFHNSDGPEQSQSVQQLSGGQKSIIAVALILAMQKVHPVPIYLLDEIDQALDPSYRENVAQYIKSVAEETQFICTTFRREFVEEADRHFGVLNANTVRRPPDSIGPQHGVHTRFSEWYHFNLILSFFCRYQMYGRSLLTKQ